MNVPWGQAVAEDGTFKSAEELKKVYGAVGIDGKKPIITYCRIGERSSHTWFALSKILGYNVKNYDGSWTCLLYTSPSPRDRQKSRMPSSA